MVVVPKPFGSSTVLRVPLRAGAEVARARSVVFTLLNQVGNSTVSIDKWRVNELRACPCAISYRAALCGDQGTAHTAACGRRGPCPHRVLWHQRWHRTAGVPRRGP